MTALGALMRRDIRIALRVGGGALIGVLFFLTVVVLMPFAIGPDLVLLKRLGPAILWLGALLASLLTLDRLFTADHEDGSLDLIVMSRTPLELACAAKALAHWLTTGLPLVIAASPGLGTINHTLLTLEAARTAGLEVSMVAVTPWPDAPTEVEASNLGAIAALGGVRTERVPRLDLQDPERWPALSVPLPG